MPLQALHAVAGRLGQLCLKVGDNLRRSDSPSLRAVVDAGLHRLGPALRELHLCTDSATEEPAGVPVQAAGQRAGEDLGQQLAQCSGLRVLDITIPGGIAPMQGLLPAIVRLRRLSDLAAWVKPGTDLYGEADEAWAGNAGRLLSTLVGTLLLERARAGLPPLALRTDLLSDSEARALEAELLAAGHAGYALAGFKKD